MKNRIQKWGNSLAVRVPKPIAAELGWGENTPVALSLDQDALIVKTDRERAWDLETLLSGVTGDNIHVAWGAEGLDGGSADSAVNNREGEASEAGFRGSRAG
jgi:antitoxin MazE